MQEKRFNIFLKKMIWQSICLIVISVSVGLILNSIRSDALELPGDWRPEARMLSKDGKDISISLDEARRLFREGSLLFLDARPVDDYEGGHILNSISLPFLELDMRLDEVMEELPDDKVIVTYCDGETCTLSHDLANALIELGFNDVRVLFNGWSVWKENQLPIGPEGNV